MKNKTSRKFYINIIVNENLKERQERKLINTEPNPTQSNPTQLILTQPNYLLYFKLEEENKEEENKEEENNYY